MINAWKNSYDIIYTRGVNPKPQTNSVSQNYVSASNIHNSIKSDFFSGVEINWHIYKHKFDGTQLLETWDNCQYN